MPADRPQRFLTISDAEYFSILVRPSLALVEINKEAFEVGIKRHFKILAGLLPSHGKPCLAEIEIFPLELSCLRLAEAASPKKDAKSALSCA